MWMPTCQAARSAAKKKAATAIRSASLRPGQWTGWPVIACDDEQERQRQRQPPNAGRDRADAGQADEPRPKGERAAADHDGGKAKRW